ncbi:paralemmin-3 isoform X2 [Parambassis ranga]|uniref:Paralemmin-3 isoform X2 n=1 Tax=Parambassis ranga TaxID=210632 RepID=A0A6P7HSB8_9TELE|nr:paralemmin-3-like isoform X2 [Parambassis ranga]
MQTNRSQRWYALSCSPDETQACAPYGGLYCAGMDEAEKYKQRLEAIAEKRRLQEEQERVRREMEDEKLRLQQLKRKSLRDQWLMEGAPLSPTSMDAPRSPLWGTQAQDMEKHVDKLQSENQRLAEEQEKLAALTEDGQMDAVNVAEAGAETVPDVVQNGEKHAAISETTKHGVTVTQSLLDHHSVVLTNGEGDLKADTNHKAAEHQSTTNGPIRTTEGVTSTKLESDQGVSEAEPGQVPNIITEEDDDDDEGTLVMRAECVIITDEGEDVSEELTSQEEQQPAITDTGEEGVEEEVETETAPEAFTESENSEAAVASTEGQPGTGAEDTESSAKAKENEDAETKAEDPASVQLQSPADALEGATVASVLIYSEAQPSSLNPELEAVGEASVAPEAAEKALKAQDQACPPSQFHEVPLGEPQETQRTEAGSREQEPLLVKVTAPTTKAMLVGANSPAGTETQSPTRASQGEETQAPKRKTCQCCSVM